MPRKPNYGFDKRRKEQDRKAKKDAKLLDKQRRQEQTPAAESPSSQTDGTHEIESSRMPPNEEL